MIHRNQDNKFNEMESGLLYFSDFERSSTKTDIISYEVIIYWQDIKPYIM